LECGGKRNATPLWVETLMKSKAPPMAAHSKSPLTFLDGEKSLDV